MTLSQSTFLVFTFFFLALYSEKFCIKVLYIEYLII